MNILRKIKLLLKLFFTKDITKDKALRVGLLRMYSGELQKIMNKIGYKIPIIVEPKRVLVNISGIIMDTKLHNRYFKIIGNESVNQGEDHFNFLKKHGIKVKTMVDVGAFMGEIGIYFGIKGVDVIFVEPVAKSISLLKKNIDNQPIKFNYQIIEKAVYKEKSKIKISNTYNGENSIMTVRDNYELVYADTLDNMLKDTEHIDFMKIDIEGAEPYLYESFKILENKVDSIYIEVWENANHKHYWPLLKLLWENYNICFNDKEEPVKSLEELNYMVSDEDKGQNYYFIK